MKRARQARSKRSCANRLLAASTARPRLGCEILEERQLLSVSGYASTNYALLSTASADPLTFHGGFTPAEIGHAYGVDQITFAGGTIVGDGAGQTVAIVDAFHNPNMAADLAVFHNQFFPGLPMPSFSQVSQTGGSAASVPTDPTGGWEIEEALDVEWVHALAPAASIVLVEANDNFNNNLDAAVNYAASISNVSVVSCSWGGSEYSTETNTDSIFTTQTNHTGVVFTVSTGDNGAPGGYPAYSPNVLAVGGTSITLNGQNNITSETVWNNSYGSTGGGISTYESQPAYQSGVVTQSNTKRTIPDVSFEADPGSGVAVYDSYTGAGGWIIVGGTSLSAPCWAGLLAIVDQGRELENLPALDSAHLMPAVYSLPSSRFRDIVSGNNGYPAGPGYDLTTGLGSPIANLLVPSLVGTAQVSGTVFNDANGNGTLDGGENGLSGWTVYEDLNNNGALDPQTTTTLPSTDTPKAISNGATAVSNLTVSGLTGNIIDVNVTVNISDSHDSDLTINLISPSGTVITLADRVGGSNGHNYTSTVFDDQALLYSSAGTAPFTGTYAPVSALSSLVGTNPNSATPWKLQVVNHSGIHTGTLTSWSLQIKTGDVSTTTDVNGNYLFTGVVPGSFPIAEVVQSSFNPTVPASGKHSVVVAAGDNLTAQNFGNQAATSATPTGITLDSSSDTGASQSDGITKLNNNGAAAKLQFQVTGTVAGAQVSVYADATLIGTATAAGTTTLVTTNGTVALADTIHSITVTQLESGKLVSASPPALSIRVDTIAPQPSITPVLPNPHLSSVSQMTISFGESVSGVDLTDLRLTYNGGASNLLTGAERHHGRWRHDLDAQ